VATSHTRTVPASELAAISRPSGLNATLYK
jgi:hypothetical protein